MYDIYVYGDIGESWSLDYTTAKDLADKLNEANGDDVTIHVNSGGGDVFDANTMAELIRSYKGRTTTVIEGFAASAASYFALTADEVKMGRSALMMIHNPYARCVGDAEEMRKTGDMLDKVRDTIVNQYESKTGMGRSDIESMMDAETYMSAERALELGFVDSVIESEKVAARVSDEVLATYKNVPESLRNAAGEGGSSIQPKDDTASGAGAAPVDEGASSRVICTNGLFLRARGA